MVAACQGRQGRVLSLPAAGERLSHTDMEAAGQRFPSGGEMNAFAPTSLWVSRGLNPGCAPWRVSPPVWSIPTCLSPAFHCPSVLHFCTALGRNARAS